MKATFALIAATLAFGGTATLGAQSTNVSARQAGLHSFRSQETMQAYLGDLVRWESLEGCGGRADVSTTTRAEARGDVIIIAEMDDDVARVFQLLAHTSNGDFGASAGAREPIRLAIPKVRWPQRDTLMLTLRSLGASTIHLPVIAAPGDSVHLRIRLCPGFVFRDYFDHPPSWSGRNLVDAATLDADVVRRDGDHLVILRDAHLYSVSIARELRVVDAIDLRTNGRAATETSYEALVVSRGQVAVIGQGSGGNTEVRRFRRLRTGRLEQLGTYQLKIGAFNFETPATSEIAERIRLSGDDVVLLSAIPIPSAGAAVSVLPTMRRWMPGVTDGVYHALVGPGDVYAFATPAIDTASLYVRTRCSLGSPLFSCRSTVVVGRSGAEVYQGSRAMYLWTPPVRRALVNAVIYRFAMNGDEPGAVEVAGRVSDPSAFFEDSDGMVNIVLRSTHDGRWDWAQSAGPLKLLRIATSDFDERARPAEAHGYRALPDEPDSRVHAGFADGYAIVGTQSSSPGLWGILLRDGKTMPLRVTHQLDAIRSVGQSTLIAGGGNQTSLSRVIADPAPRLQEIDSIAAVGLLHAGVYTSTSPSVTLVGSTFTLHSASTPPEVVLTRLTNDGVTRLGAIQADSAGAMAVSCGSCADRRSYGRTIFAGDQVFALIGRELITIRIRGDQAAAAQRLILAAPR